MSSRKPPPPLVRKPPGSATGASLQKYRNSTQVGSLAAPVVANVPKPVKNTNRILVYLLIAGGGTAIVLLLRLLIRRLWARKRPAHSRRNSSGETLWDVCVVGAGPAGATCAYFLAKQQLKVLLIDKSQFPRDKICGDQVHQGAIAILNEMGVMQTLLNDNSLRWSVARGVVSPTGASFVGDIREKEGLIAVQRIVLDDKIVSAATKIGAVFRSNTSVKGATFERSEGSWTLYTGGEASRQSDGGSSRASGLAGGGDVDVSDLATLIKCRVLVCADGAQSTLAHHLEGLTTEESPSANKLGPPNAIACRAFAKQYTHEFRADDVIVYPQALLPGYFRLFAELDDYLNLTCFMLPHPADGDNSQVPTQAQVFAQFYRAVEIETWIKASLGKKAKLSHVQTAPLRVGGVPQSYMPHGLILGDAAGQQDPLTGDGLQYGMRAAKVAAQTIVKAFQTGDFSMNAFKAYHKNWKAMFGWDFFWAKVIVSVMARYPRLIDATTRVIHRKGMKAILLWALVRSGIKSKWEVILWFFRPDVWPLILFQSITLWLQGL